MKISLDTRAVSRSYFRKFAGGDGELAYFMRIYAMCYCMTSWVSCHFSKSVNIMTVDTEHICWYVMTGYVLDKRWGITIVDQVEKFNDEYGFDFEVSTPAFVKVYNEAKDSRRLPLVCQYFFMRGRLSQVKYFRSQNTGYNLVHDKADKLPETSYLRLSDEDMSAFRSMALAYKYNMLCLSPSEVDLVACDKVRIVGGEFAGVEGYLVSQQGREGRRVIIKIGEVMAVQTLDINPKYISVLSFAKGSRDSYVSKMRRAMDYYRRNGELDVMNAAAVGYFITRFGLAEIPAAKMLTKVSVLLAVSYYLMGGKVRYEAAKRDCETMVDGCLDVVYTWFDETMCV